MTVANAWGEEKLRVALQWTQSFSHARWKSPAAAAAAKSLQSCLTLRPHRRQPTRLPRPWDSPGKNTGVSCHFLLRDMKVKSESEVAQSCLTLCDPMDWSPPGSSVHGILQRTAIQNCAYINNTVHLEFMNRVDFILCVLYHNGKKRVPLLSLLILGIHPLCHSHRCVPLYLF